MIDQLETLRALIEEAVADSECVVDRVLTTAGRPAAPSADDDECRTAIYVFGASVVDGNQTDPTACIVASRWAMQYEIWTCYPENWEDQTAYEGPASDCLYGLMQLVWCALVDAKDQEVFCACKFVELTPLEVQPRSGGAVSALGSVVLPYFCPAIEDSPTSP